MKVDKNLENLYSLDEIKINLTCGATLGLHLKISYDLPKNSLSIHSLSPLKSLGDLLMSIEDDVTEDQLKKIEDFLLYFFMIDDVGTFLDHSLGMMTDIYIPKVLIWYIYYFRTKNEEELINNFDLPKILTSLMNWLLIENQYESDKLKEIIEKVNDGSYFEGLKSAIFEVKENMVSELKEIRLKVENQSLDENNLSKFLILKILLKEMIELCNNKMSKEELKDYQENKNRKSSSHYDYILDDIKNEKFFNNYQKNIAEIMNNNEVIITVSTNKLTSIISREIFMKSIDMSLEEYKIDQND